MTTFTNGDESRSNGEALAATSGKALSASRVSGVPTWLGRRLLCVGGAVKDIGESVRRMGTNGDLGEAVVDAVSKAVDNGD